MDIQQLLQDVDAKKVSIIMQVNLQHDQTIKSNATDKFIRAVESFKAQLYKNCELIIVSDGCKKVHQIYNKNFKNDSSIKFVYYDREEEAPEMKSEYKGGTYFRGFARRIGQGAATGDLITYMDADDFLLPEFTITLMLMSNQYPDKSWWINSSWFDDSSLDTTNDEIMESDTEFVQFDGMAGNWKKVSMVPGYISNLPWLLMHRSDVTIKWRDALNITEYTDFNSRLRSTYENGATFDNPIYVRGYLQGKWDN